MRIGLNLLHAMPEIGGGWNYISNLVSALGKCDPFNNYVAFVTRISRRLLPGTSNVEEVLINIDPRIRAQRVLYENTLLPFMIRKHDLECMHWFAGTLGFFSSVPNVVTLYDMQPFMHFAELGHVKRVYQNIMVQRAIYKADLLLTMSASTANDVQNAFGVDPSRTVIIPSILTAQWRPDSTGKRRRILEKYGLPDEFWLYVAHLYPHKNHLRLLGALNEMKARGSAPWTLVLRGDPHGSENEVSEAIRRYGLGNEVILLPRLEEGEMLALYSTASALAFPSLYEGGGIPVIEAMACGCPVVAADIPSVKEHAGDAAVYFDPNNVESIARALIDFQDSSGRIRADQIRKGLEMAAKFKPGPIIAKLVETYRSVIRGRE